MLQVQPISLKSKLEPTTRREWENKTNGEPQNLSTRTIHNAHSAFLPELGQESTVVHEWVQNYAARSELYLESLFVPQPAQFVGKGRYAVIKRFPIGIVR